MTTALACCLALLVIFPASSLKTLKHTASINEAGTTTADLFSREFPVVFANRGNSVDNMDQPLVVQAQAPISLLAEKQDELESLAMREQAALRWQQQALATVVGQEKAMEAQEQEMMEESKRATALLRGAHLSGQQQGNEDLREFMNELKQLLPMFFQDLDVAIIVSIFYFAFMLLFAWIYGTCFTYEYPKPSTNFSKADPSYFSFSLFEGCKCDPDRRIPLFSCCCLPVRWADTASAPKLGGFRFWPTVVFISALLALAPATFYITAVIFTVMAIVHRQKIRKVYGMPYWTYSTFVKDCLVWSCCPCCATMQEALQMEFVDPPDQVSITLLSTPSQHSMLHADMLSINAIRKKNSCC